MLGTRSGLVLTGMKDLLHCNAKKKQQVICLIQQVVIYCTHPLLLPVIHVHQSMATGSVLSPAPDSVCHTVMPLWMQPRFRFAFALTSEQLVVHQEPRSLSSKCCPATQTPTLLWGLWLCHPRNRILHTSLLNFIKFQLTYSSSLPKTLHVRWLSLLTCSSHQPVWRCQQTSSLTEMLDSVTQC